MYTIVPLAGPDFIHPLHGVKPLFLVDGSPLVERALRSRPWYASGEQRDDRIIFVLRETSETLAFQEFLRERFKGCRIVTLSGQTKGALLTALAGAALIEDRDAPICVDLVDILYSVNTGSIMQGVSAFFNADKKRLAILPYFESDSSKYSYLRIENGLAREMAEKRVISSHASAGTYIYRDMNAFLDAVAASVRDFKRIAYKDTLYVCPSLNALAELGEVHPVAVEEVISLSERFH